MQVYASKYCIGFVVWMWTSQKPFQKVKKKKSQMKENTLILPYIERGITKVEARHQLQCS